MQLFIKPKKSKTINQCPICGAALDPITAICPDCKYEGAGSNANDIVEDFAKQIKQASFALSTTTVIKVVESFPVPSGRNDLLEMLAFLCPKIKPVIVGDKKKDQKAIEESHAYFQKFKECILKVKTFYPNDPAFAGYLAEYRAYTPTKYTPTYAPKKQETPQKPKKKKSVISKLFVGLCLLIVLIAAAIIYLEFFAYFY